MKKYKVIKDQQKLSDKEIEGFKSFSGLAESYQRATKRPTQPMYKNKWMFFAILVIVLLALWISGEI